MAKIQDISKVIDEIVESISTTSKKQRRIRSGTFWNKFGFERRTKERVEAVKSELRKQKVAINLEDSVFGSEKRGELIVLSQNGSAKLQTKKEYVNETQNVPQVKHKELGEPALENVHKHDQIEAKLKHLAEVRQLNFNIHFIFSVLFVEIFWNDTPSYELSPGVFGATRSNWTYHTAGAISQTCKILDLTCKFEALGKRDAIIETKEQAEIILAAEWEWDYNDIFGAGKELEKLRKTCQKNPTSDAFLLIYCPITKYLNHLEKISEYWINETKTDGQAPTLFLHTVIFEEKGNSREFLRLKTVMIHSTGIDVWSDSYL